MAPVDNHWSKDSSGRRLLSLDYTLLSHGVGGGGEERILIEEWVPGLQAGERKVNQFRELLQRGHNLGTHNHR